MIRQLGRSWPRTSILSIRRSETARRALRGVRPWMLSVLPAGSLAITLRWRWLCAVCTPFARLMRPTPGKPRSRWISGLLAFPSVPSTNVVVSGRTSPAFAGRPRLGLPVALTRAASAVPRLLLVAVVVVVVWVRAAAAAGNGSRGGSSGRSAVGPPRRS